MIEIFSGSRGWTTLISGRVHRGRTAAELLHDVGLLGATGPVRHITGDLFIEWPSIPAAVRGLAATIPERRLVLGGARDGMPNLRTIERWDPARCRFVKPEAKPNVG